MTSQPLRVLLLDDNHDDRAMTIHALRREFSDLQVEQITDADSFDRAMEAGDFDLVITDYSLCWTDGLTVVRTAKATWPDCPVVMFTATGSEKIAVEAMKAGLDDYLCKSPQHFDRLPAVARSTLEKTQRRVRKLSLLDRIPVEVGAELHLNTLINGVLERLQELANADRTYFITLDPITRTWEKNYERILSGIKPDVGQMGTFDDMPVELKTLLAGRSFAVFDIATDPRVEATQEVYRSLGMQSLLLMPVQVGNQIYGALGFGHCREKHAWHPDEVRLLKGVAHQLELALENVQLLEEARLRADELAAALAQLEELDRLKNEFIQNVSHELRSPLAIIRGYAEILEAGELGELRPEQKQPVAVITRRARMLGELVQDITRILEAEISPPKPEAVLLDRVVRIAVEDHQVTVEQAELTLHTEIAPHLPPVSGSYGYLRRMLDNLLSNAIKFTPAGGTVTVRVWQEGEQVALEVSDTGIGIPSDQLERIFERFYQVDGSTRRQYGGLGLGLALVKQITESYGGRVTVQSQVGEESTFTVWLPIAADTGMRGE